MNNSGSSPLGFNFINKLTPISASVTIKRRQFDSVRNFTALQIGGANLSFRHYSFQGFGNYFISLWCQFINHFLG